MEGKEKVTVKRNGGVLIAVWCDICIKSLWSHLCQKQ